MGHIGFIFIHFIAILLGFWLLIITIPLHIIYGGTSGGKKQLKKQVAKQTSQAKRDIRKESSDRIETGLFRMQQDSLRRTKPKTALRHQRRAESNSRQNQ